jgi:hypothetical protein
LPPTIDPHLWEGDMSDDTTTRRRLRLPRPGTVLGAVALFLAMQGVAAALPGVNTVDTGDIINGEVKSGDIGASEVRAVDIHAGAVRASELGATWITGLGTPIGPGATDSVTATCPAGYQAVGTGFNWDVSVAGLYTTSLEITATNAVTATGFNDTAGNRTLSARAYCIVA